MDSNELAITTIGKIAEIAKQEKITERDIERYKNKRDIAITEITRKYDFLEKYLDYTFEERRKVIEKYFEIIDKGIEENNFDLIISGMSNITSVVRTNPFSAFFSQRTTEEQILAFKRGELPPL